MAVIGEALFSRRDQADVNDVVRHVGQQLSSAVDDYDQHRFDSETNEQVVEALVQQLRLEPLEVNLDHGSKSADEISLSVRDVFGGQARVPGYRVAKTFPFTGNADLWSIGVGSWSSSMPRAEVSRGSITVGTEVRADDTDSAVQHIKSTVEEIRRYLDLQRKPLEVFNASLSSRLLPLVQARRTRRWQAQNLLDQF